MGRSSRFSTLTSAYLLLSIYTKVGTIRLHVVRANCITMKCKSDLLVMHSSCNKYCNNSALTCHNVFDPIFSNFHVAGIVSCSPSSCKHFIFSDMYVLPELQK